MGWGIDITSALYQRTLLRRSRCRDTPSGGSGRDVLRSGRGGNAGGDLRATVAWQPSVQPFACRRVDRGCRARPRSTRRSSGRCGSCSGHRSSIPVFQAQSLRHDGSRSGTLYRVSSPFGGATNRSEQPNSSGQASLPNNE